MDIPHFHGLFPSSKLKHHILFVYIFLHILKPSFTLDFEKSNFQEDPHSLIIVEGLDFATDLRGVLTHAPLHRDPRLTNRPLVLQI